MSTLSTRAGWSTWALILAVAAGCSSDGGPPTAADAGGEGDAQGSDGPEATLAVTSVSPAAGPVAGGTRVQVTGRGFIDGAAVSFGDQPGGEVVLVSANRLAVTTPAASKAGKVSVTVANPDGARATLSDGFEYRLAKAEAVDFCVLQHPPKTATQPGVASEPIFARVWEEGCSEGDKRCEAVQAELGVGLPSVDPSKAPGSFTWLAASYNPAHTADDNDEYQATLELASAGSYAYAFRVSIDGGASWTYCDLDGSSNGFDASQIGQLTVASEARSVGWCALQHPPQASADPGQPSEPIFGRVLVAGCSEGAAECQPLKAEVGYGPLGASPVSDGVLFSWTAASYNPTHVSDNNDEYQATVTVAAAGSYGYAFRFSVDDGASWSYCDLDGSSNGFDVGQMGTLAVGVAPGIDWCAIKHPPQASVAAGVASEAIYGQVYVAGCTDSAAHCAEVSAEVGFGDPATDPSQSPGAYTWVTAVFNVAHVSDDNDEYQATLKPSTPGSFGYAYRFSRDNGATWSYCDLDGSGNGFDTKQLGQLTVSQSPTSGVDWCALQWPSSTATAPSTPSEAIFGRVYVAGCTDGGAECPTVSAQLGHGDPASDPSQAPGSYTWVDASYNDAHTSDDNDEYQATLTAATPGSYAYAYRFSVDGGGTWRYCDLDGSHNGYDQAGQSGQLTVAAATLTIDWCNVQWPSTTTTAPATPSEAIFGRVHVAGCTDGAAQCAEVSGQLGFGTAGADPVTSPGSFVWTDAAYNPAHVADDNDEHGAPLAPTASGSYVYAYRFTVDGGSSWSYCDLDGSDNGVQPDQLGQLTVSQPQVASCRLQHPATATTTTGVPSELILGRARVPGCTDGAASCAALIGQLGYGSPTVDPSVDPASYTWVDAGYNAGHVSDDEDEHGATLQVSVAGAYAYAYRFSIDGGATWTTCDLDGSDNGVQLTQLGALTVSTAQVGWCQIEHPAQVTTTPGVTSEPVYGRVFVPGCSDGSKQCAAVTAELGVGPAGADPEQTPSAFDWVVASYNPGHTADDNDEYSAPLTAATVGSYSYAYRFSVDGGATWTTCDLDGDDGYAASQLGALTVTTHAVDWCTIQHPASATVTAGQQSEQIYGRVHVAGCTDGASQCPGLLAELGVGPMGGDPSAAPGSFTWAAGSLNPGHVSDDNDEYSAALTVSAPGSYGYAYRFSGDGGATWSYCDSNGSPFAASDIGALTVQ